MVWKGIKNYFINLKHYFTPLGAFALGIVIGFSILIPGTAASIQDLVANVSQITGNTNLNFRALTDSVSDAIGQLDWERPSEALNIIFSADWLNGTFNDCIHALLPEAEEYAAQISGAIEQSITEIVSYVIVFFFMSALGLLGGFLLTRIGVKRTIAKRSWWKNILSAFFDLIFTSLTTAVFLWLRNLWAPSVLFSGITLALLYCTAALLKTYVIYGWKKIPVKKIVNLKNTWLLMLTNFLVFLIAAAFVSFTFVLTNSIAASFISIPFVFIGFLVIIYNAEAYVKIMMEQQ